MTGPGRRRRVPTPTSRLRVGLARTEITPPVGIHHRFWGAARHDRATGVHRPLLADVLVLAPSRGSDSPVVRVQLDLLGLTAGQQTELTGAVAEAAGVPPEAMLIAYSHSHSSAMLSPDRVEIPGGHLIAPYLEELTEKLSSACRQAVADRREAILTLAAGRCGLAANRDHWDEVYGGYVCGTNPDAPADDTVVVGRLSDLGGRLVGTIVNYACHPTTLAWENTLLSRDYVGAMREVGERATGAPCVFVAGAGRDLGPWDNFVGGPAVADRNGEPLGYAAASALASLGAPVTDFEYEGAVISGATLGVWRRVPLSPERQVEVARFSGGTYTVDLPLKPRPDRAAVATQLREWQERQREADGRGDRIAARDAGAMAERARRWLAQLASMPEGTTYALRYSVHRLGDAVWVACGGEPYNAFQVALRDRFPKLALLVSGLTGDPTASYILPSDRLGKGLYQEEVAIPGPGSLEALIESIAARIKNEFGGQAGR